MSEGHSSINVDRWKCDMKIITSREALKGQLCEGGGVEGASRRHWGATDGSRCGSHLASVTPSGRTGQFFGSGGRLPPRCNMFRWYNNRTVKHLLKHSNHIKYWTKVTRFLTRSHLVIHLQCLSVQKCQQKADVTWSTWRHHQFCLSTDVDWLTSQNNRFTSLTSFLKISSLIKWCCLSAGLTHPTDMTHTDQVLSNYERAVCKYETWCRLRL